MKRRNADFLKIRRPIKKNKIAEQIGSNTLLYVKFLLLWASVITADFLVEFRFEFLWPFWLLLRSVYDSFKYKGLAFSILFVCIAITSDLVCLFFIPVQWLFFAASTYVWVQYVWHTDKGICLPTIILWILFVYLEAAIRWKDSRNIPHLDLCRPFAAHCIGYPVVTLGFGFKSYVGYRIRQRKQREVAKDNDFYMQLLQEALPKEETNLMEQTLADSLGQDQHHQQKELTVTTALTLNSAATVAAGRSDGAASHHNNHHHHHNYHHSSKSAQNHKSSSNVTAHVNGHVGSGGSGNSGGTATTTGAGGSTTVHSSSPMNGGVNHHHHQSHQQQSQQGSKHRKSLDKDNSSGATNGKLNGGYSYHQHVSQQQSNSNAASINNGSNNTSGGGGGGNSLKDATRASETSNGYVNGSVTSPKEKDSKDYQIQNNRKDYEGTTKHGWAGATATTDTDSSTSLHQSSNGAGSPTNRTSTSSTRQSSNDCYNSTGSSVHDASGSLGNSTRSSGGGKHQQNGHVVNCDLEQQQQQQHGDTSISETIPTVVETRTGRSGRKNRIKQQKDNANLAAVTRLCATLALATSITTLTTTTATTSNGNGNGSGTLSTAASTATVTSKEHHHNDGGSRGRCVDDSTTAAASNHNTHTPKLADDGHTSAVQTAPSDSTGSTAGTPVATAAATAVSPPVAPKVCEVCPRLEAETKKLRQELGNHKQTENDMRQKYDSTTGNLKACLQVKQKEYDELQCKYQELSLQRQQERHIIREERRHLKTLESQLSSERKHRKQAEEKAARAECSEACKLKKQQLDMEIGKLRRDLFASEDAKHTAEKQNRNYEQEMRKFEVQMRTRETQQNPEMLMSALAKLQDKNVSLEKSLSAETRVKLDLFSALGDAKRQIEIHTSTLRSKDQENHELKAKFAQMLAVMPSMPADALCMSSPGSVGSGSSGNGGSMMRLSDASQRFSQSGLNGVGPVGPGQQSPISHIVMNGPPLISQLTNLGGLTSTITTSTSVMANQKCPGMNGIVAVPGGPPGVSITLASGGGGQIVQMQNSNNCPSNLDPNATVYTPKNTMVGGTEA